MTVLELRETLEQYGEEDSVIVAIFKTDGTAEICDPESLTQNGPCLQINVYEEKAFKATCIKEDA